MNNHETHMHYAMSMDSTKWHRRSTSEVNLRLSPPLATMWTGGRRYLANRSLVESRGD